ncbi:MAG TPA: hypothetical protein VFN55_16305 [Solirubrobacteraceae bacterium]|nr:hypothetical protein [Solirubrobacteraceae bacterium]
MHTTLRRAAVSLAAVIMLAGCGSSSSSSTQTAVAASKATFCRDNATIDKATASATTAPDLLKGLKATQSAITEFGHAAPAAISAQAKLLVDGANAAIKANDASGFATAKFVAAGKAVNSYCGQQADGSPVSG